MSDATRSPEELQAEINHLMEELETLRRQNIRSEWTEESLRRSEQKFRQLAENVQEVFWLREKHAFIYVNPAFERVFGVTSRGLHENADVLLRAIHPEDRAGLQEVLDRTAAEPEEFELEVRGRHPEKGERHLVFRGFPVRTEGETAVARQAGLIRDITEHRRAELERREEAERFQNIVDNVRDLVFSISPEGSIRTLNPAFETLLGLPRQEWTGRSFLPLVHPDERARAAEYLSACLRGDEPGAIQLRTLHREGHYFTMEFTAVAEQREGEVVGILGVGRDITQRQRSQKAELAYGEKLRAVLDSMDDLVFLLDADGCFETLPQRVRRDKLMMDPTDFLGRHHSEIMPPEVSDRFEEVLRLLRREGGVASLDYSLDLPHGLRHFSTRISARHDVEGRFLGVTIIARDVTEQVQAAEELNRHRDHLQLAQRIARLGVWTLEAGGEMSVVSDSLLALFEIEADKVPSSPEEMLAFYHPDDRDLLLRAVRSAFEEGTAFDLRLRGKSAAGQERKLRVWGHPATEEGEEEGVPRLHGVVQDITELVHAYEAGERAREIALELRTANKVASTLAHEFNTPLNVILTAVEMVTEEKMEGEHARQLLQKVPAQIKRLTELVDRLLRLEKLDEIEYADGSTIFDLSESGASR